MKPLFFTALTASILASALPCGAEVNQVTKVAPEVYFHEGDLKAKGHCNNGWIIFEDYVLVIDGNFPSGAKEIIPKIKAITDKPIRFVFDTHHHGDHAYGNQVWVENGVTPVAHAGVIDEMKKYETGTFGDKPGRWEDTAKKREDVAASKLKPPTLLYKNELIFDDGKHRVELLHFGVAHTHGDGWAWLPNEKILFTGDACVNGPYNFASDGDIAQWIQTLEAAKKLGAKTVCPGHGPIGGPEVLDDQQAYFVALTAEVKKFAGKTPQEMQDGVGGIRRELRSRERISRYVGDFLDPQVEKVFTELGGKAFLPKAASNDDRTGHALAHGDMLKFRPRSAMRSNVADANAAN